MALQHLRSSTANKRPAPSGMSEGQLAINTNDGSPGLFFKDNNSALVKAGPVHVGATAPNVSPASGGTSGNSKGESWLDNAGANPLFKVWDGSAWQTIQPVVSGTVVSTASSGVVTSTMITDGTIVNADINNSAAIVYSKLALSSGIVNTDISASAAIAYSKLATLTAGNIVLGDASNIATSTAVTGDVTISNAGVTTIGSGTITSTKIADLTIVNGDISASAEIAVSKLADGAARQLLQTDAAGTGVEWTDNVDIPGTLDVTGATKLDSTLSVPSGLVGTPSIFPGTDSNTGFWSPSGDSMAASVGGAEILRMTADKYLRMASSTGGVQFGGDTAAANALDDYEEGTWTVELYDAATGGNVSSTTATGNYTKIGNTVLATFVINSISTVGMTAGNTLHFTLPLTSGSGSAQTGNCLPTTVDFVAGRSYIVSAVASSAARGTFPQLGDNAALSNTLVSHITSGTSNIRVSICYLV